MCTRHALWLHEFLQSFLVMAYFHFESKVHVSEYFVCCAFPENIHTPRERSLEILRGGEGRGVSKTNIFKGKYGGVGGGR